MTLRERGGQNSSRNSAILVLPQEVLLLVMHGAFPLILPANQHRSTFCKYHGFVDVQGEQYLLSIEFPTSGVQTMKKAKLKCSADLRAALKGNERVVEERLAQSADVQGFLVELQDILERALQGKQDAVLPPATFYSRLVSELDALGWDTLVHVNESLTSIQLKIVDAAGREHIVTAKLQGDYPISPPQCSADLPSPVPLRWSAKTSSLSDIMKQYSKAIGSYQGLWEVLDDIDANTWVIEPEHPSRSATMRRIALRGHCSIQVDLDDEAPRAVPECRFLGADAVVGPLRERLNEGLQFWDETKMVRENLERLMQVEFPSPKTTKKEEFSLDCGICYSYRLDPVRAAGAATSAGPIAAAGSIPDIVCTDTRCNKPFHQSCLFEWLSSVPSTRQSFDTLFGNCPYCSSQIVVKRTL